LPDVDQRRIGGGEGEVLFYLGEGRGVPLQRLTKGKEGRRKKKKRGARALCSLSLYGKRPYRETKYGTLLSLPSLPCRTSENFVSQKEERRVPNAPFAKKSWDRGWFPT